jgi:predicted Zn-dependent protease
VSLAEKAGRLNPFPEDYYESIQGDSLLFARRIEEALAAQRRCVERVPDFYWCRVGLALTYVEAGRLEDASSQVSEALRINPRLTAADNSYVRSIGGPAERTWAIESLRRAGLE